MMNESDIGSWLQRFFREHLSQQRSVSVATIGAYRDTFRLFLRFLQGKCRKGASALPLEVLTADNVLAFLNHLESDRHNSVPTRNARLAAIRSFVGYLDDWLGHDLPSTARRILAIPFKRYTKPMIGYLRREEIEAILEATDETWTGRRNYLLFLLLYNTGARISEILNLRVRDVLNADGRQVRIEGKGRKRRSLPIWRRTQRCLRRWIKENHLPPEAPLFANRFGQPLTRSGAAKQLNRLVERAKVKIPKLQKRRVSPHQLRHSLAMHMLEAGVAPEVIALWLGHESPNTTHGYVETSLSMKRQALASVQSFKGKRLGLQPKDALLSFLDNL